VKNPLARFGYISLGTKRYNTMSIISKRQDVTVTIAHNKKIPHSLMAGVPVISYKYFFLFAYLVKAYKARETKVYLYNFANSSRTAFACDELRVEEGYQQP
jgi:hypothetical protein